MANFKVKNRKKDKKLAKKKKRRKNAQTKRKKVNNINCDPILKKSVKNEKCPEK